MRNFFSYSAILIVFGAIILISIPSKGNPENYSMLQTLSNFPVWEDLGGGIINEPTILSHGENKLEVFVQGTDRAIYQRSWNGFEWSIWQSLGGEFEPNINIKAVSAKSHHIDLFIRDRDSLWHKPWDGEDWQDWNNNFGELIISDPTVISNEESQIEVFAIKEDGSIIQKSMLNSAWIALNNLGGNFEPNISIAAVLTDFSNIDLFVRGRDSALWHTSWNGTIWNDWNNDLSGKLTSNPTAISRGQDQIDVFVQNTSGGIHKRSWDGLQWSNWQNLGGVFDFNLTISAISTEPNRIDLFARGREGYLWHKLWDGSRWHPWNYDLGGIITSSPAVAAKGTNQLSLVARNTNYGVSTLTLSNQYGPLATNKLGIGTTNVPYPYLLAVDGSILCEEVRVKLSENWPDYVFAKDYDLMPLEDLAQHIQKEKHLPGIPSASEMENDGIAVGEMQRKMMEKIEELTLYIIGLKRENKNLKVRMERLER